MSGDYQASRFTPDPRRGVLWKALWRFWFSRLIAPDHCVLELGAGYGEFINSVVARRRVALDIWPGFTNYLTPGVEGVVASATDLDFLDDQSVDFVFASNLFEHLTQSDFATVLDRLRPKLRPGATLNILQPNYRYAFREYFDDYTHVAVYSHISLGDFLTAHGYTVIENHPRFLPLTIKSRLPISPRLIQAYLLSPFRPMGKQMLIRARVD
jgi:ubiquinone/menaquinone biosynthesis C-methylase UbiE